MVVKRGNNQQGFTLLELMITVAVIAIVVALAVPNYMSYVKRTKRVEVQGYLTEVSQKLENYKLANNNYSGASLSSYGGNKFPISGSQNYQITLTDINQVALTDPKADNQTWLLVARPIATSSQKGTGAISLTFANTQCWYKDKDNAQITVTKDASGASVPADNCSNKWSD